MKIIIHRGAQQIGGCITEISNQGTRIVIDVGSNLPGVGGGYAPVSRITKDCTGVFITHYHGDHIGEYRNIGGNTPVYMGKQAKEIFKIVQERLALISSTTGVTDNAINRINDFQAFEKFASDDITVTPIRTDHSAFDSYMFLVEGKSNNGEIQRILHTGDFRTHGYYGSRFLDDLRYKLDGKTVDVPICEGTMLSRKKDNDLSKNYDIIYSEEELHSDASRIFSETKNVFILCSSTNIDTISSFYSAARKNGKLVIVDHYQEDILNSTRAGALNI